MTIARAHSGRGFALAVRLAVLAGLSAGVGLASAVVLFAAAPDAPVTAAPTVKEAPATKSARDDAAAEKLGWRVAVQAYTFRALTFFEAVDICTSLGVKYIEAYPGQLVTKDQPGAKFSPTMSEELQEAVRKKLQTAGVKLVNIGVIGIPAKEEDARKFFDFCKKMGIETIVTETTPNEMLDKLCGEYKINMALHNHPASWPPEKVLEASKDRSSRVGACADTGHWMRANRNPVDTLKMLKGRIVSLHFKDLNEMGKGHDVPWGTGKGDAKAMLTEIKDQGFKGVFSIEYESGSGQELIDNVAKCVAYFDKVAGELAAGESKK